MSSTIGGISGVGMNITDTVSGSNSKLDQMDFLKLLMIQLSYQDPLNPMDSAQFSAQLAEFSQLEQLTLMNENLDYAMQTNLVLAQSVNNTMAATMIGQDVLAYGNEVELEEGEEATLNYNLSASAQTVTITIKDEAGVTVRTIEVGAQSSDDQQVVWDGLDDDGDELPAGVYTFSVSAETSSGTTVQATTYTAGTINGVSYVDGMAQFLVGSMQISLGDVYKILSG